MRRHPRRTQGYRPGLVGSRGLLFRWETDGRDQTIRLSDDPEFPLGAFWNGVRGENSAVAGIDRLVIPAAVKVRQFLAPVALGVAREVGEEVAVEPLCELLNCVRHGHLAE